jgi:ABC-type uncharacterized transport system fused permease/ATPase subunit
VDLSLNKQGVLLSVERLGLLLPTGRWLFQGLTFQVWFRAHSPSYPHVPPLIDCTVAVQEPSLSPLSYTMVGDCTQVRVGERVLLRGSSGAGKSSLVRCLSGLWPLEQVAGRWVVGTSRVLVLPQDAYCFRGALSEQVRGRRPGCGPGG